MPRNINKQIGELYEALRREFETFPTGARLPSYRTLRSRYNCSRQTLNRTIRLLADNALIRLEERHGIFATHKKDCNFRQIIFLRVDWVCEHAEKFSQAICEEMSKRQNYRYSEIRYSPELCQQYVEQLEDGVADVVVLWLEDLGIEKLRPLCGLKTPLIFFDCGIMLEHINVLDIQEEMIGMMAAKHLIDNGHRKLAVLVTEPKGLTCQKKMNGFLDYVRLHGISPQIIDCKIQHGEASQSMTCDFILKYFKTHRIDFSACFIMSDYSAFGAMQAFHKIGLRIPQDISIVGCQGEMAGELSDPPLTTIILNAENVAQALVSGLDELFSGGEFGIRRIAPVLIERGSVKKIL